MERPTMKENLKGYSIEEVHKIYTDCPELYRYIVKLDEYIDDLEDKLNNLVIPDVVVPNGTLCECKYPLVRTGTDNSEYCGFCNKDL